MFWSSDEDALTQPLFELEHEIRCQDAWLSEFLEGCRNGDQSAEHYYFMHGLPTMHTGCWLQRSGRSTCENLRCHQLNAHEIRDRRWGGKDAWNVIMMNECGLCQEERARRQRVMKDGDSRHTEHPFTSAPYVHPYNTPKYHAQCRRAQCFAREHRRQL